MKQSLFAIALMVCFCVTAFAQEKQEKQEKGLSAGIPVNYDEEDVGDIYDGLPDPLVFNNGKPVKNAKQWEKRRAEIIELLEVNQYGRWPEKPPLRYTVDTDEGLGGEAVRKQVTVFFSDDNEGPRVDVLIYLPKQAKGPSPLLLNLSFFSNNYTVMEPGVKDGRRWDAKTKTMVPAPSFPMQGPARPGGMTETIKKFLDAGFGFATLCYTDITPDFQDDAELGVRGLYPKPEADGWGSISAWAWGISQVIDYFEVDNDIDAKRIALTGSSRLGKTTMWTGARERRIAVVIPSCSGEGGAALSRRDYGETVAHLTEPSRFPYQFAPNYAKWGNQVHNMPVDAHMIIACIAPRPLLLSTGALDKWSDPKGEFISAVLAGPVYRFLGKDDLGVTEMPEPEQPIYHTLGYVMHKEKHGVMPQDWDYYLEFLKRYL